MGLLRSAFSLNAFKKSASSGKVNQARTPDQDLKDVISGNMPATDFDLRGYDPEVGGLSYEAGELTQALEDAGLHVVDDRMGRVFVGQTKEDVDRLMGASNPYEYGKAYGYSDDDIAAFYKRLRGDNDEVAYQEYLRDRQTSADVDSLVMQGFPESTARKIATGELPMDFESRMQRARELGYDVDKLFYHGTPEAQAIADMGFDPNRLGQGNDQMGAGFYFTDNPYQASGYAQGANAGVIPSLLRARNSQEVDIDAPAGFGIELDQRTTEDILNRVPNIRDEDGPLSDFIEQTDISGYTDDDIASVASMYVGRDADILLGDMFKYDADAFLKALTEATGIDSVVTKSARESDPTIRTVFDPSQIRSPNAAFDPEMRGSGNILASPAPVGVAAGLLATEAMTPEGQLNPLLAVPAEVGSALNEAIVGTLDFIGPDTINAVSQLAGSEFRVPRLSDQELVRRYTQGGYMQQGAPRNVVRTATGLLSPL